MAWTREEAGHLLRRAGFGGSLSAVDALVSSGRDNAINQIVDYQSVGDTVWSSANPLGIANLADDWDGNKANYMWALYSTKRPLEAKLIWFWHGHFVTPIGAGGPELFRPMLLTWRANAAGKFGNFLKAVYKDGNMLRYLNGAGSNKESPNENFAREVMELFSCGHGPYTETDIKEGARALTGWDVTWPENQVVFRSENWDSDPKTILGQTGNFNGESFMQILASRSDTARRICIKLYRFFVSERVNLVEIDKMVKTWNASGGDIRQVLRTMFTSAAFWDPRNRGTVVKNTLDFGFGLMQRLGVAPTTDRMRGCIWQFGGMGQQTFDPPNPAGYAQGLKLTGASALLARAQFSMTVIYDWATNAAIDSLTAGLPSPTPPTALVNQLVARLGAMPLTANTSSAISTYLGANSIPSTQLRDRARDVAHLIVCSPEYQVM